MSSSRPGPPDVSPVLQIGIVGAEGLVATDQTWLREQVRGVLTGFQSGAEMALARWPQDAADRMEFRCVSSLATASSRLAVEVALQLHWKLLVGLPCGVEDCDRKFAGEGDREEFDRLISRATAIQERGEVSTRFESDASLARFVLEQSDVLVALWDGNLENGTGVVGEIVRMAREADIVTVLIGRNVPNSVQMLAPRKESPQELAARMLSRAGTSDGVDGLDLYLKEQSFNVPQLIAALQRVALFHATLPHPLNSDKFAPPKQANTRFEQVKLALGPYLSAADNLAMRYASLYRASVSLKYLAIIPTTAAALVAFYGPARLQQTGYFIELALFTGTLLIARVDHWAGWHRRFVDYRYLAEHLRFAGLMAMFGTTSTLPRLPPYQMPANSDWVNWYLHFVVRRLGLIILRRDDAYRVAMREIVGAHLNQQLEYYNRQATISKVLASRLQRIGMGLFVGGIIFTIVRLFLKQLGIGGGEWFQLVTLFAFAAPALAPAFFGLRSQREYQRLSQRYEAMVRQLLQYQLRLNDSSAWSDVERVARETVETVLEEVADWRVLIKARTIGSF